MYVCPLPLLLLARRRPPPPLSYALPHYPSQGSKVSNGDNSQKRADRRRQGKESPSRYSRDGWMGGHEYRVQMYGVAITSSRRQVAMLVRMADVKSARITRLLSGILETTSKYVKNIFVYLLTIVYSELLWEVCY